MANRNTSSYVSHNKPNPEAPLWELDGKVAFITGGSSGIGLGIARACSEAGMKVIITYRTPDHYEKARTYFESGNAGFHAIHLDVTDREGMARAADEAEEVFGKVHLLVNNAGVGGGPVLEATFNDWDFAIGVNVMGVVNAVQTFVPRMVAHDEPAHVVSTASMSGLFIGANFTIYTTTKYAVVGMMEALRAELVPHNIGVSAFCPGGVQSNIVNFDRNRPDKLKNPESVEKQRSEEFLRFMRQIHGDITEQEVAERLQKFMHAGMDPLECGRKVLRGVRRNDMFIITHPEYGQGISDRNEALSLSVPVGDEAAPEERLAIEQGVLTARVYTDEIKRLKGDGS